MPLATQVEWDKLRIARITKVNYATGTCEVRFFDRTSSFRSDVFINYPYVGRGWGILCGAEAGSLVIVGEDNVGRALIVSYFAHAKFFDDNVVKQIDVDIDESAYRKPISGEIILQSKPNSALIMNDAGDVILETAEGNRIEIDAESDTIYQQSSQHEVVSDAGRLVSGVVRRDIRSLQAQRLDIVLAGSNNAGYDFDIFHQTIGIDPKYPNVSTVAGKSGINASDVGVYDPSFPDDKIKGRACGTNVSDMINPGLTEINLTIKEFSDGNPGLDEDLLDDRARYRGHMEPNALAQVMLGTAVNLIGKQTRFDYGFDNCVFGLAGQTLVFGKKGHANVAWVTKESESGRSRDRRFDRNNTLESISKNQKLVAGHNEFSEWTVESLAQTPTATMFSFLLHTKGVNNDLIKESELGTAYRKGGNTKDGKENISKILSNSYAGSLWSLQVDKEGLTKINIPAATDVDGIEPYRAGRSLLLNLDGDVTATVGRQRATSDAGLDKITNVDFLNRNAHPYYGRRDRSITLDCAGNIEARIGADDNTNQSLMIQADGSCAISLGKEIKAEKNKDVFNKPNTLAAKTDSRIDRSLTARLQGNAELEVGHDEKGKQSIIISTTGGNAMHFGKDIDDQSLKVVTTGGIDIRVQGPMKQNEYAIHIDATGKMHIKVTGAIQIETNEQCAIFAKQDVSIATDQSINLMAKKSVNINAGESFGVSAKNINLRDSSGASYIGMGSSEINLKTKNVNANLGESFNMLGNLGVIGQLAIQDLGTGTAKPIARVGDQVQVGPAIGQIISGSKFSKSI